MRRIFFIAALALLWAAWTVSTVSAGSLTLLGAGGPGAAGCTFPTISGLIGRWRADVGVTTSGGNVTAVADQSGNGNNLVNTGTVPLNATGSAHGQPAFGFTAANAGALNTSGFTIPMGSASSTASVFVVGQMLTNTAAFGGLVGMLGTAGQNDQASASGFSYARANTANAVNMTQSSVSSANQVTTLGTQFRFGAVFSGTSLQVFLNNVSGGTTTSGLVTTNTTQFVIGERIQAGAITSANPWEGPISEVVLFTSALSSTDRNNLDTYFTCQWGT